MSTQPPITLCAYDLDGQCDLPAEALVMPTQPVAGYAPVPTCWEHAQQLVLFNDEQGWPSTHHVVPLEAV